MPELADAACSVGLHAKAKPPVAAACGVAPASGTGQLPVPHDCKLHPCAAGRFDPVAIVLRTDDAGILSAKTASDALSEEYQDLDPGYHMRTVRYEVFKQLMAGSPVCYRHSGWCMFPRIQSGDEIQYDPVTSADQVMVGDIVFYVDPHERYPFCEHQVKDKEWNGSEWIFTFSDAKGHGKGRGRGQHILRSISRPRQNYRSLVAAAYDRTPGPHLTAISKRRGQNDSPPCMHWTRTSRQWWRWDGHW